MLAPASRRSATPTGQISQSQPRAEEKPFKPVGLATDLTFGAMVIGQSAAIVVNMKSAVKATAVQATHRQRGLTSRPLGKSRRMKRKAPAGKTRSMIQFESHAIHFNPGSPVAPRRPCKAYSPETA